MGGFSSKKKSRVTEQDKAVLQLKQQRDRLRQCQRKIESNLEKDRNLARLLLKDGKKERAKLLLRKKKFQEDQLNKVDKMLENIEKLTTDLEYTLVEMKVLEGLKAGNAALKKLHEVINIDEVERIMDETREGIEKQQEIDDLLQGQLTTEDEDAVLLELDEIIKASREEEAEGILENLAEAPQDKLPEIEEAKKVPEKRRKKEKVAVAVS